LTSPATAEAFAPAKVNLCLHVTGRRADGYHLIDSLVVFADVGDRVTVRASETTGLRVTGPRAGEVPRDGHNLVLRAAALHDPPVAAAITLDKRLPVAAGLGGGSADAAACLLALSRLSGRALPDVASLARLGADLPVCVAGHPARMQGIGERIARLAGLPPFRLVLVHPGAAVATGAVYAALARHDNSPMPDPLPSWPDAAALAGWLAGQRNDLEPPARAHAPAIDDALAALAACPGCLLARMSGSGATCFGLFAEAPAARAAAAQIAAARPDWWVAAAAPLS